MIDPEAPHVNPFDRLREDRTREVARQAMRRLDPDDPRLAAAMREVEQGRFRRAHEIATGEVGERSATPALAAVARLLKIKL